LDRKSVMVIGLGRFGSALAKKLVEFEQRVIGVDKVRSRVEEMADVVDIAVQLDSTDPEALIKAGVKECDVAVVTIGENIEASVLTTSILRDLKIPRVIARANNVLHARVLARVGAHRVIFPERDMGQRLAEIIVHPWISDFTALGGKFLIGELPAPKSLCGKTLAELNFSTTYNIIVLLVRRGESFVFPRGSTQLYEGDKLIVAGFPEDVKKFKEFS